MDRHKLSALFALLIVSLALESLFNLPVYLVILLLIIAFGFIWYSREIRLAADVRKNNENLLHELKTSSSDSHLTMCIRDSIYRGHLHKYVYFKAFG